ncbi:DNA translocase FtsK 4TM domain-containing protein [Pendulispora rubella]|uniref:DNA translocase FtsK 4TM domain-containing protein n=1 Tax=Pendulispora rubella TaxID=2741070 RepID=A0ABZ2L656_9BACT
MLQPRWREVSALLLWTTAVFLVLGLASYEHDPATGQSTGEDWVGPVGAACAHGLVTLIGLVAWTVPLEAALLGIPFVRGQKSTITPARLAGDALIALTAAAMIQVGWPGRLAFGHHVAGGVVGELFGELSRSLFSTIGSFLVGFAFLGLILIGRASFSFIALIRWLVRLGEKSARGTASGAKSVAEAWQTARQIEREKTEKARLAELPRIGAAAEAEATIAVLPEEAEDDEGIEPAADSSEPALPAELDIGEAMTIDPAEAPKRRQRKPRAPKVAAAGAVEAESSPTPTLGGESRPQADLRRRGRGPTAVADDKISAVETNVDSDDAEVVENIETKGSRRKRAPSPPGGGQGRGAEQPSAGPTIVDTSAALAREAPVPELEASPAPAPVSPAPSPAAAAKPKEKEPTIVPPAPTAPPPAAPKPPKLVPAFGSGFRLPSIDFLIASKQDPSLAIDHETLLKNAELLVKTLGDYGVSGKVEDILPGPTVTTFEVSPAAGTKVSKVASLADDLALALARKVRIVAPIPGKNRIGFELPNERRIPVSLRDLVEDRRFQTLDAPLPVVLGRDILGAPVYADLASMPHVIVAGATGAGKSVGLNVMLSSLLYRRTPEELRLLMIDPKVVELAPFDRIPHMLLPVVTDMKQAATALKWAVDEMERRYQLFADAGTKNIGTFNAWVDRVHRGEARNPAPKVVIAKDHNGLPEAINPDFTSGEQGEAPLPEKLPLIVIVVDEFADLMMQQGKDVEAAVARLAQKARAAGMHVILATQRPSVDVITGMIKANFPTRIAFRVAQKVDSRTILDEQGAEHLLGRGDMLIKLNGTNETKRVQCPMITEEEVQAITDFLRLQGEPVYDENILKPRDDEGGGEEVEDAEQDAMYDDAVRMVADTRRCSTSWLQRKLGLGYNRAARIVEMMERRGLVGPANGAKDREVLIDPI